MKTIKVYKRTVLERTGYRKYPYKEATQISIFYDGKEFKNHDEKIDNPRLKVNFKEVLYTRSEKAVCEFVENLGRTEAEKFAKATINKILEKERD